MTEAQERAIAPERRKELVDIVRFFAILIEEDRQQKISKAYENLNR